MVFKRLSFCKCSWIGNAQIPEESLGERRKGCSWEEVVRKEWGQGEESSGRAQKQQRADTSRSC